MIYNNENPHGTSHGDFFMSVIKGKKGFAQKVRQIAQK